LRCPSHRCGNHPGHAFNLGCDTTPEVDPAPVKCGWTKCTCTGAFCTTVEQRSRESTDGMARHQVPARRAAAGHRAGADLAICRAPVAGEDRQPRLVHVLVRGADAADVPGLSPAAAASRLLADAARLRGDHGGVFLAVRVAGAAVRDRVAVAPFPVCIVLAFCAYAATACRRTANALSTFSTVS